MSRAGGRYAIQQQDSSSAGVDLELLSITASPSAPTAGEYVTFTLTIRNNGQTAVQAGRPVGQNIGIGVYIGGSVVTWTNHDLGLAAGATLVTDTVSGWAPGGVWYATEGTHTVQAFVDDLNYFAEGSEVNNTKTMTLTVAPGETPPPPPAGQFFRSNSTWNTPIPAGATYTDSSGFHAGPYWINASDFGLPVLYGTASDPLLTVTDYEYDYPPGGDWGWPATTPPFHCPENGIGASGSDGTMCVVDTTSGLVYDMWRFVRYSATTGGSAAWARADYINGDGWGQLSPFLAAGIHACGSSCLAGTIMRDDLKTGFNHTIAIAFHASLVQPPPARVGQAIAGGDGWGGPLIYSQRYGIPPSTPRPASVTSTPAIHLWNGMKTYGAFLIDVAYGDRTGYFGCDTACDPADIAVLLNAPTYNTIELNAIGNAMRIVT